MKISTLAALAAVLLPIAAHAQEVATQTGATIVPGRYHGMVFQWPADMQITSGGALPAGTITGYPSEHQAMYGVQPITNSFRTHVGDDGLPETKFPSGTLYKSIHQCGNNICAVFCNGGKIADRTSNLGACTNVVLVRQ